ncbi:hypothetical protein MKZ38_001026 [Zalerion maritima]|uniref:Uncharacterized protein n=1 Tax=Zalerion maritima TaxID=339359 RepID=A0AAD5RRG8_9PEZI|nr:hypothetical protein MKZ38_001026 [Zalerion maritima]
MKSYEPTFLEPERGWQHGSEPLSADAIHGVVSMAKAEEEEQEDQKGKRNRQPVMTFASLVERACGGTKMFQTKAGLIGTGGWNDDDGFRMIGACHVHGMMDGKALDIGLEEVWFNIA